MHTTITPELYHAAVLGAVSVAMRGTEGSMVKTYYKPSPRTQDAVTARRDLWTTLHEEGYSLHSIGVVSGWDASSVRHNAQQGSPCSTLRLAVRSRLRGLELAGDSAPLLKASAVLEELATKLADARAELRHIADYMRKE